MLYKNYLVFDVGASNGRSIIGKFNGFKFEMEKIYMFENRPVYAVGKLYWDILRLYSEIKIGIQSAVEKYKNIASLGIDTWGCDFGLIDKYGKLISNPVHYRDKKRNSVTDKFYKIVPKEELFNLTGGFFLSSATLFHFYSLKIQNDTELVNANKFLMMPDIFNYFLSGVVCNEFTNSTTTNMYNQKEKKWEDKILEKLGISKNIFAEMIMPGDRIGNITNDICSELEIKTIPVIAPATHDTASAVAGVPITKRSKNWAFISIGTWCVIGKETKSPIINKAALAAGYVNEGGVDGLNIFFKNITGLWIIQKCREKWIKDKGEDISWKDIDELYPNTEPFKSFIDVDDAVFYQPQVDMPRVVQEYCRETGQNIPESIGEISRCLYESLVLKFRFNLYLLEKLIGKKIEILYLMGGGTKNRILCQWTSDITGIPVVVGHTESTVMGNLLMQLKGVGEINTLEEGRNISLNSSEMIYYESLEKDKWDEEYSKYLKIL